MASVTFGNNNILKIRIEHIELTRNEDNVEEAHIYFTKSGMNSKLICQNQPGCSQGYEDVLLYMELNRPQVPEEQEPPPVISMASSRSDIVVARPDPTRRKMSMKLPSFHK